ncbi:AAA family ATPase [Pseudomonas marginalis]
MIIESLTIEDLHKSINLTVNFNKDITLLVGINGCGKTSILNVIDWLLKPNLQLLAVTEYKKLELEFTFNKKKYTISSVKTDEEVVFSIAGAGTQVEPIGIKLLQRGLYEDEMLLEAYGRLSLEKHELPMWDLLKSFSKPTVITLDRTITAETDESSYVESASMHQKKRPRNKTPLAFVGDVTAAKYAEYREKSTRHDEELKARIVMSALQNPEVIFNDRPIKHLTPSEITKIERKVVEYLSKTIKTDVVVSQVKRFFEAYRDITRSEQKAAAKDSYLIDFFMVQYRQVENLAKAFNDFELKNASAFKELKEYLETVNGFLNDSNKTLYFDDSIGKLVFSALNRKKDDLEKKSINLLSSGEKQILILFTFLALISKNGGIFIVDEPELSLHPKWQHEFMDAFVKLCPKNTQLILATHSPDIVGKYKKSCVIVKGQQYV